jgi:hypothetical protein
MLTLSATCGGNQIVRGIHVGKQAENGNIGLQCEGVLFLPRTEPLLADHCISCGTVTRLRVQNTRRKWLLSGTEETAPQAGEGGPVGLEDDPDRGIFGPSEEDREQVPWTAADEAGAPSDQADDNAVNIGAAAGNADQPTTGPGPLPAIPVDLEYETHEPWVVIARFSSSSELHLAAGVLAAQDIPAALDDGFGNLSVPSPSVARTLDLLRQTPARDKLQA